MPQPIETTHHRILVGCGVLATGAVVGILDYLIAWFSQEPYRRFISLTVGLLLLSLIPVLRYTRSLPLVFSLGACLAGFCFLSSFLLCSNVFFLALGMCVPIAATMCAGTRTGLLVSVIYCAATLGCSIAVSQGWIVPPYTTEQVMRGTLPETICVMLIMIAMCGSSIWREKIIAATESKRRMSEVSLQKQLVGLRLLAEATTELLEAELPENRWDELLGRMAAHLDCQLFTNYEVVGEQLFLRSSAGLSGNFLNQMRVIRFGEKVCGQCASTQMPIYLAGQQLKEHAQGSELWELGVRTLISVPLKYGNQLVGTLAFASTSKSCFADDELDFVTTVGQLVASVRGRAIADAQKRSSDLRFRTLVDCAADAFFLIGPGLRVIDVNRQACISLGYERDELLQMRVQDIAVHLTEPEFVKLSQRYEPHEVTVEMGIHRRKDGTEFPVEVHLSRVCLNGVQMVIALAHDISKRKRLEERLAHLQKMEAIGRLAGGVAHDFNNLLCVINSYSEMLLDRPGIANEDRESLLAIYEAGKRGASLTSQLLVFSRKAVFAPKAVDLNEVVIDAKRLLTRLIGENIVLEQVLSPRPCGVLADRTQLDQILINLAVNGRDAMPQGGRLRLQTRYANASDIKTQTPLKEGYYVQLIVRDEGCGISPNILPNIFDPFFTTKDVGEGTGLGLAVVYGIVNESGGCIDVNSHPEDGTTFTLTFPAHPLPEVASKPKPTPRLPKAVATVLLVEDELAVRQITSKALKRQGYNVIEANGCLDAIELAKKYGRKIDVLVTDVIMPELNGPQLVQQIRSVLPDLPVLYMSGYSYDIISQVSDPSEMNGLLHKPFSLSELAIRVHETICGKSPYEVVQN